MRSFPCIMSQEEDEAPFPFLVAVLLARLNDAPGLSSQEKIWLVKIWGTELLLLPRDAAEAPGQQRQQMNSFCS